MGTVPSPNTVLGRHQPRVNRGILKALSFNAAKLTSMGVDMTPSGVNWAGIPQEQRDKIKEANRKLLEAAATYRETCDWLWKNGQF